MQILKKEVRDKIMESALKLFATKGFKNTTISDVAASAGISVGNIYNYFPTKKQLFADMLPETVIEKFKNLLIIKFQMPVADTSDTSDRIISTIIEYRYHFIILMEMSEDDEYSALRKGMVSHFVRLYLDFIKKNFNREINLRKYRDLLGTVYTNLLYGIIAICKHNDSEATIKDLMEKLLTYHLTGIRKMTEIL